MSKPSPFFLIVLFHLPLYIREHWNGSLQTTQICVFNFDLDLTGPWLAACGVLLALPLLIFVRGEYVFQYFSTRWSPSGPTWRLAAVLTTLQRPSSAAAYLILWRGIGSRESSRVSHMLSAFRCFFSGRSVRGPFTGLTNDDHGRPSADAGQRLRRAIAYGEALTSPPANNDDSPSCGCHFASLAIDRSD